MTSAQSMGSSPARLVFLGTGAAGGTPGTGRTQRLESSAALVAAEGTLLIDVTRDFAEQVRALGQVDAVLLTHAHRDAAGGIAQLRRWWSGRRRRPIPVYGHPVALERVRARHRRLDHCDPRPVEPGSSLDVLGWRASGLEVPHAGPDFPTLAWRLDGHGSVVVYASDVAEPGEELGRFAAGAEHLALDGATWGRRIFSHLRVDEDVQVACGWDAERIWLTQIGRSAPPHDALKRRVAQPCPHAEPAYDGLEVRLE